MSIIERLCRIPQYRQIWCKRCKREVDIETTLAFCQHRMIMDGDDVVSINPVLESGEWEGRCRHGHQVRQAVDHNLLFMLTHPDDFVQPDDPRFKTLYPQQYEQIQRTQELEEQKAEAKYRNTEIANKQFKEQFGHRGQEALKVLEEKHPELSKVS